MTDEKNLEQEVEAEETTEAEEEVTEETTEEVTDEITEEVAEEAAEAVEATEAEEGAEAEAEAEPASGKKERNLGWTKKGKAKKTEEEKAALECKVAEANDKYARLFAEFDNYRKRTDKEKSAMFAMGAKDVLEKILPIVDNFERGLALVEEDDKEDAFSVGMEKIYKQLIQTLEGMGVTPIEAVGQEFDPNIHNAVMHVDDENVGENIIVEEFQKGYMYKDTLLRPSMVKVAN